MLSNNRHQTDTKKLFDQFLTVPNYYFGAQRQKETGHVNDRNQHSVLLRSMQGWARWDLMPTERSRWSHNALAENYLIDNACSMVRQLSLHVDCHNQSQFHRSNRSKSLLYWFSRLQTGGLEAHGLIGLNFLKSSQVSIDFKKIVLKLDKDWEGSPRTDCWKTNGSRKPARRRRVDHN